MRDRLNIADVIGEYVSLTPAGKGRLKGLCPFHKEKTPSFQVDTEQGYYHCFGCKASGDVFKFVQETENLSFGDALRKLAERAGVQLEQKYGERVSRDLYDVNDFALQYFRSHLRGQAPALAYFQGRGLTAQVIEDFELGFAPDGWDGLLQHARTHGLSERSLLDAGLLTQNDQGRVYDRFRNRVMFPIRDHLGRLVGFGGRVLDDSKPKYLNTPETDAFKKGELLYGLHRARSVLKGGQPLIVAEGYMDVIALQQHGFAGAVASLGTALTAEHAALLERLGARELVLMFDRDEAGLGATLSGLDQTVGARFQVRATSVPSGKDPADALREGDVASIERALQGGLNEIDYRVQAARAKYGLDSRDGKRKILMELLPRMQNLDPLDEGADQMRAKVCELLDIRPQALLDWIGSKAKRRTLTDTHLAGMTQGGHEEDRELALLRQLLVDPRLLAKLDGTLGWRNELVRKVMLAAQGAQSTDDIMSVFRGQPEEGQLIRLMFETRQSGNISRAGHEEYEAKQQTYAAAAVDDIQTGLSIESLRGEVKLLKSQLLEAPPTQQASILRQITELQRAIEAEKRARVHGA
ncbi:DNA primase [Deinococcus piscis]|uniref:DNA primase n=1 Tax=Deinococcus piscis TaxID=394230 RepID=A0ABQ3JYC4_9DEIO|nr:DNA primase [Deinococcus piscis]GHF95653.1 DNA primase [Deinococcus piscis]